MLKVPSGASARWQPRAPGVAVALALWLGACASPEPPSLLPAPAAVPAAAPIVSVDSPPTWRPGDQWVYDWKSGADTGVKVVEVLEIREVNRVSYYIVRIGDLDHLYTKDLHWAGGVQDSKVLARMIPPIPWFVWPLEPGRRWSHLGTYEDPQGKRQHSDTFAVVGGETVDVPAGRFSTLKLAREGAGRDSDEYWYAPEVRFYVKWVGRRGEQQFEEMLREHRPSRRLIPESAPPSPPSRPR